MTDISEEDINRYVGFFSGSGKVTEEHRRNTRAMLWTLSFEGRFFTIEDAKKLAEKTADATLKKAAERGMLASPEMRNVVDKAREVMEANQKSDETRLKAALIWLNIAFQDLDGLDR